jgi:pimeloyl-ACP methyl ester carboxylesterase
MTSKRGRIIYLHGFASSPHSRKASVLGERLGQAGFQVEVPRLDEGDFSHITISRQLRTLEWLAPTGPVALIGSSLGGYLAALFANRHAHVSRLILLAPAFDFLRLWETEMGPERMAEWRQTGSIRVFHYGAGKQLPLYFDFIEDARQFEPFPAFGQPALIFHGENDRVVPIEVSRQFVETNSNARLLPLSSGHELTDVLDPIWQFSKDFLEMTDGGNRC